jgi:hypothetical protein
VDVEPVDPRDVKDEDRDPVYRVYFWESTAPPGTADEVKLAGSVRLVRLSGL